MKRRPQIGLRVKSRRGVVGVVLNWPKKLKHRDKVLVKRDGQTGVNSNILVKYSNLELQGDT